MFFLVHCSTPFFFFLLDTIYLALPQLSPRLASLCITLKKMTDVSSTSTIPATAAVSVAIMPSITNHIVQIPHPHFPFFLTQIVHLSSPPTSSSTSATTPTTREGSSLFVHLTSISPTTAHSLLPSSNSTSTNKVQSKEEEALDAELNAALVAAGPTPHSQPQTQGSSVPLGALATDFALAMAPPPSQTGNQRGGYRREPTSTSISTTSIACSTSSLANSISKRIAYKLSIPQLLLSLSLPDALLPTPGRVQSAQDSRALLALEKGLRDACSHALSTPSPSAKQA